MVSYNVTMKLKLILLFFISFLTLGLHAQITVNVSVPSQAEVGQQIRIRYVINTSDVDDFQVGNFEGLKLLYGPSKSSSSSFSMTNGKTVQSSSLTLTYIVAATKPGTVTIPVATVMSNGKQYKSLSKEIEILPASDNDPNVARQPSASSNEDDEERGQAQRPSTIDGKDLYMTVTASKTKAYEQEAILLTYKLYTLVNVQQVAGEMPTLDGFHVQELESKQQMSLKYERVNGRNYGTVVWRQYLLFPQKSGKVTVPGIKMDAQVEIQNTSMDPFDIFFGGGSLSQIVKRTIVSPSVQLDIRPLPTPKPESFSGAVGQYSVSASLTPEEIKANDAATLRLVISGQGNAKLIKAPKVNLPKDFEVYDPKQTDKTENQTTGAKGNLMFDYIIVPRHGGKFGIPPVEFSYFNPETEKYVTLKTDSFNLNVAKGSGSTSAYTHEQEDLKILGNDIRYIKQKKLHIRSGQDGFFGSGTYWMCYLFLSLVFVILLTVFNRYVAENANIAKMRGKKAGKAATRRLKTAKKLLDAHNSNAFYDEVMRALLGYVADKLSLPTSELNKDNLKEKLTDRRVQANLVEDYVQVLSECEYARFAPGDPNEAMEKIYNRASDVINKLDAVIK